MTSTLLDRRPASGLRELIARYASRFCLLYLLHTVRHLPDVARLRFVHDVQVIVYSDPWGGIMYRRASDFVIDYRINFYSTSSSSFS